MANENAKLGRPVINPTAITQEGVAGTVVGWNADSPSNEAKFEPPEIKPQPSLLQDPVFSFQQEAPSASLRAILDEWKQKIADGLALEPVFLAGPAQPYSGPDYMTIVSTPHSPNDSHLKLIRLKDRPSAEGCTVLTYEVSFAYGLYEKQDPPVEPSL